MRGDISNSSYCNFIIITVGCVIVYIAISTLCFIRTVRINTTFISCTGNHTWGEPKIPGIVKKLFKYLYKFETLVPFEVFPIRLDAAIPAPLPMLETLSKIYNGNAVKGRQRFAGGS
jgi:hypothetical protein